MTNYQWKEGARIGMDRALQAMETRVLNPQEYNWQVRQAREPRAENIRRTAAAS